MIKLQNVSKKFNQPPVLSNLSFEVPVGSVTALLGLTGSGKTTALKLVCGLVFADEGQVLVDGQVLNSDSLREIRKKIGYVIQDGGLFPHLTAFQNLALVGQEVGFTSCEIQSRTDELADLTKISKEVLSRYPRELSGGQRQRIGVMRALFLEPPILLLDEPLGALDPITRSQLQKDLKELFRKMHKTVLLVTHDLFEAGYLANRILLLNEGSIAQSGTLQELTSSPANDFVKLFVGSQQQLKMENL